MQVVTAPLIGKVSEVSTLRIIGTILGGMHTGWFQASCFAAAYGGCISAVAEPYHCNTSITAVWILSAQRLLADRVPCTNHVCRPALGPTGLYGFCTFEFGLHVISAYGSSLFVSLMAPTIIVFTTYLAYKKGLEQLARFMQVWTGAFTPRKGKRRAGRGCCEGWAVGRHWALC